MDDHRVVSVSRVYVPNEYAIYLSPADREQFSSYEDSLRSELQEYIAEHARRENYALTTRPRVRFETDGDLDRRRLRHRDPDDRAVGRTARPSPRRRRARP